MNLDPSFYQEEIRSDYLVTKEIKKVWAVELELLERFDEVCRKHQLTYYAAYGTLIGAARHQGFVPWDDDIDLFMFRDDYMKLLKIGPEEFTQPFFLQNIYTDIMIRPYAKLRDSRTTAIEHPDMDVNYNQGIFIDIFPLDDVPYGDENTDILQIQKEMWQTVIHPMDVLHSIEENKEFLLPKNVLFDLMRMDLHQRMQEFENFALNHFGQSEYVNFFISAFFNGFRCIKREWFKDVIYLPFEHMQIPVPSCYEQVLTCQYGDWHKFVRSGSLHQNIIFDPDVPYATYINLYQQQKV